MSSSTKKKQQGGPPEDAEEEHQTLVSNHHAEENSFTARRFGFSPTAFLNNHRNFVLGECWDNGGFISTVTQSRQGKIIMLILILICLVLILANNKSANRDSAQTETGLDGNDIKDDALAGTSGGGLIDSSSHSKANPIGKDNKKKKGHQNKKQATGGDNNKQAAGTDETSNEDEQSPDDENVVEQLKEEIALEEETNGATNSGADEDSSAEQTTEETEQLKTLIDSGSSTDSADDSDDVDSNPNHVPAPRTTEVEYSEIEKPHRYLLYNPSGGMTNQELELVNALAMARLMKRTLYVPMIGRHSNLPAGYNALGRKDLFPSDRLFDFEWMNKYCRVVPLNISVKAMVSRVAHLHGSRNVRMVATDPALVGSLESKKLSHSPHLLVFLNGAGMWSHWFSTQTRNTARHYISFSPYLRKLSMRIADSVLGRRFYAIHGRLGDEAYRWEGKDSGAVFVQTPEFRKWDKSLKLYLASDDPGNPFFRELKNKMKVVTSRDLKGKDVEEFRNLFPNNRVMQDMFGVLDKLICTQAIGFLGSFFSTFTLEIFVMRSRAKFVFPELYMRRHNLTHYERQVEVIRP